MMEQIFVAAISGIIVLLVGSGLFLYYYKYILKKRIGIEDALLEKRLQHIDNRFEEIKQLLADGISVSFGDSQADTEYEADEDDIHKLMEIEYIPDEQEFIQISETGRNENFHVSEKKVQPESSNSVKREQTDIRLPNKDEKKKMTAGLILEEL